MENKSCNIYYMVKFSLMPGNSLDITCIPDIEVMNNFIKGDLGISKSIFKDAFNKNSKGYSSDTEVMDIFSKNFNKNTSNNGLSSLEKTIVKSIFETQKPYIDVVKSILDALVILEDIIIISKAGKNSSSLKQKFNPDSLYSKLNKLESKLNNVNKKTQPKYNSYSNININEKKNGISIKKLNQLYNNKPLEITNFSNVNFDYITVSEYYSTGTFVENIQYNYSYKYINELEQNINIDPVSIPDIEYDDLTPNVIFDIWVDKKNNGNLEKVNDISTLPWDISEKWLGEWDQWSKDKITFNEQYKQYVIDNLNNEFNKNNINDLDIKNEIEELTLNSIPFDDSENDIVLYDEIKKSSIYTKITKKNYKLSSKWKNYNKFGYIPKKINNIYIDPEKDYHLQLVKISPSKNVDKMNSKITNNPLVSNYDNNKISDILITEDYDSSKFISNENNNNTILYRNRYDKTSNDFNDNAVYYVIEGIYKDRKLYKKEQLNNLSEKNKAYKFGPSGIRKGISIAIMISRFIKFASSFLPKLIKTTNSSINIFTDPFNFIFSIVLEKMSDSFDSFDKETISKISNMNNMSIDEKKKYISSDPKLEQIISIDNDGNTRFIFDGGGFVSFMGVNFGISSEMLSPKLTIDKNTNIDNLIREADVYINKSNKELNNKAENISLKLKAYQKLQIASLIDKNNVDVINRLNKLEKDTGVQSNIMLQFIIDTVMLPIKIILNVINYILDFFKSLKIFDIPKKIPEFLSFKWILDFFKPSGIIELIGINMNPSKLSKWASDINSDIKLNFDSSEILNLPSCGKLPMYDNNTLMSIINGGSKILLLMSSLFKFNEMIINKIICFLLNIFNLDTLFPCPEIELTKLVDPSYSDSDISELIENMDIKYFMNAGISMDEIDKNYKFVYDITLPNGEEILGLSYNELQSYISSHDSMTYSYQ